MNLQTPSSRVWTNKINAAYEVPYTSIICCVDPQYSGAMVVARRRSTRSASSPASPLTSTSRRLRRVSRHRQRTGRSRRLSLDELDDYEYPDFFNGYIRGGIHYKAGCQHLNGVQALQVARSRHATQPQQSSDFGRARRQQDIMQAIKKKATTVNGFSKAPQLLDALQKNIHTDMSLSDMKAIYDWGKNLPDSSIIRVALTGPSAIGPETCWTHTTAAWDRMCRSCAPTMTATT